MVVKSEIKSETIKKPAKPKTIPEFGSLKKGAAAEQTNKAIHYLSKTDVLYKACN